MNYSLLAYKFLSRVRGLVAGSAKVFAILTGAQVVILFGMAEMADSPMPWAASPSIRFYVFLAIFFIGPRLIDILLRRLSLSAV